MRILVAGAGIGGLTFVKSLQYFLQHSPGSTEFSVDIVERSPSFKEGVGIVLHPNGLQVLNTIGLGHSISNFIHRIDAIDVHRQQQQVRINMKEVWGDDHVTGSILRKHLHTLLAEHCRASRNIPFNIRMGRKLEDLSQSADKVEVQFDNGETNTYDLVIGADGVHSCVREILFPHISPVSTQLFYIRFIAEQIDGMEAHAWQTFEEEGLAYGFIPLPNRRMHCFVQIQTSGAPCVRGEEEQFLLNKIATKYPLLLLALKRNTGTIHSGFASMVQPGHWHAGHCVLLGDAAHAVSPTLSEGGSLAMEDALALALALLGNPDKQEALTLYQVARQERCMRAFRMSLAQLNTLKKRQSQPVHISSAENVLPSQVMAGMYRPLLHNEFPPALQSIVNNIQPTTHSNNLFTDLQTK